MSAINKAQEVSIQSQGGKARAKRMTPEQRSKSASVAAQARWKTNKISPWKLVPILLNKKDVLEERMMEEGGSTKVSGAVVHGYGLAIQDLIKALADQE